MAKNKTLQWLILILVAAFGFELCSEWLSNSMWAQLNKKTKPYYQFSFYTQSGQIIGRNRGLHKLMYHPQVGYVNLPSIKSPYFMINAQGFRNNTDIPPAKGDKKRVIILGGSTAFGTGLNSNEETFAYQLEKRLENTEVINAAVIGHRSGQELVYLIKELVDYQPDLVIALDGGNDAFQIGAPKDIWFDTNGGSQYESELKKLNHLLYTNFFSRAVHLPEVLFAKTAMMLSLCKESVVTILKRSMSQDFKDRLKGRKTGQTPQDENMIQFPDGQLDVKTAAERYGKNIKKMDTVSSAYQSKFICVIQPTQSTIAKTGLDDRHRRIYAAFRAEAVKRLSGLQVTYLDLNNVSGQLTPSMFMDEAHLDAEGNAVMADMVNAFIKKNNLLK